jgi:hypothetical protein
MVRGFRATSSTVNRLKAHCVEKFDEVGVSEKIEVSGNDDGEVLVVLPDHTKVLEEGVEHVDWVLCTHNTHIHIDE